MVSKMSNSETELMSPMTRGDFRKQLAAAYERGKTGSAMPPDPVVAPQIVERERQQIIFALSLLATLLVVYVTSVFSPAVAQLQYTPLVLGGLLTAVGTAVTSYFSSRRMTQAR